MFDLTFCVSLKKSTLSFLGKLSQAKIFEVIETFCPISLQLITFHSLRNFASIKNMENKKLAILRE